MKVQVTFTVDVDFCEEDHRDILPKEIEDAVEEAVAAALSYAQSEGHSHSLEEEISILMDSEVMAKVVED